MNRSATEAFRRKPLFLVGARQHPAHEENQ
jgi:hypothetical protein